MRDLDSFPTASKGKGAKHETVFDGGSILGSGVLQTTRFASDLAEGCRV